MKESVNGKNPKVDMHVIMHGHRTFGQKAADALTRYAGSWGFISFFFFFILVWMSINVWFFVKYSIGNPFDPYPFILLNLVLSCLAAIQAPVILMSQNREMQRDRNRAEYDYRVNVKAEREIQEMQHQLKRIEDKLNRK